VQEVQDIQEDQVDHSKDWLQDDFVPFEEEDSSSDESSHPDRSLPSWESLSNTDRYDEALTQLSN
jgi:hypothetical protein